MSNLRQLQAPVTQQHISIQGRSELAAMPPAQEEMEGRPKGRASYINLNPHYRGRVRSGCLTCRSCKVKCDEHRPKCKRCVRLKRGCVYPNPTSRQASATLCDAEEELSGQQHSSCNPSVSEQDLDMESRCGVLLRYSGSIQDTEPDPHPKSPSQTRLPSPGGLELSLPVMQELGQAEERLVTGSETLSQMISRDIHLCITIDWLSANESLHPLSFTYFLHEVDFHLVTPFDPVNWERMKSYAVKVCHTTQACSDGHFCFGVALQGPATRIVQHHCNKPV